MGTSIENLYLLKKFLDEKNIDLLIVLYPWSFEIDDKDIRKKYLEFITPLLKENNIKYLSVYNKFLEGNIYENIGKFYLNNDIHFNGRGNEIIANQLIKKLD